MLGRRASYEFRWRRWALLRDAVATHLEMERPGSRYRYFESIGDALGVGSVQVPADALADELREIREGLDKRPVDALVLGPKTARVLYPQAGQARARPLTGTELTQIAPIGEAKTLAQYFSSMLDAMLDVCAHPMESGTIEIYDG